MLVSLVFVDIERVLNLQKVMQVTAESSPMSWRV